LSASELFRRVFVKDFGLKFISLLLACGLWLMVARDPIAEVDTRVPIEFLNFPGNLEIDSASSTEALVRVRGPERLIHRLRTGDVRAQVDLASAEPGQRTFDLSTRQIHVPPDIDAVQVNPTQFQLSFDIRTSKTVPVRPRVTGGFAEGMRVSQLLVDPANVAISGPRHHVDAVDSATTDPIDATGTLTRATFVTHAFVSDPLVLVAHPTPIRVTVIMEREGK